MDESGDLGFSSNKTNSKYFTVSFIFAKDKKPLEKVIKKIIRSLSKKSTKVSGGVLHAFKEKPTTRQRLLWQCARLDIDIMSIYLNKSKVYARLQEQKHVLYNYVINILLDRIISKKLLPQWEDITFIASRRETSKVLNQNFVQYLNNQFIDHPYNIEVQIKTPSQEKGLQVVDFVSWATFQKYEKQDTSYWSLFSSRIIEEQGLFP